MKTECRQDDNVIDDADDDDDDANMTPVRKGVFDHQLPNFPPGCQGTPCLTI